MFETNTVGGLDCICEAHAECEYSFFVQSNLQQIHIQKMSTVLYNEMRQTGFVVLLQNCEVFVEGETGSCNETDVECDVAGTEEFSIEAEDTFDIKGEVSIKVEDAIDIKAETQEAAKFPPIETEQEVRLCGVCELVAAPSFRPFIALKSKL